MTTFLAVATFITMIATVLVTFLTRDVAKDVMAEATKTVDKTEDAVENMWALKPMNVVAMEDGRFKLEGNK